MLTRLTAGVTPLVALGVLLIMLAGGCRQRSVNSADGQTFTPPATTSAPTPQNDSSPQSIQPSTSEALAKRFATLDTNNDGKLSATEYPQPRVFAQIDANKDGFISRDELTAFSAKPPSGAPTTPDRRNAGMSTEERFKALDANGDGKVTANELPNQAFFSRVDANGDGAITPAEMRQFAETRGRQGGAGTRASLEDRFKQRDKNGDGKLSGDELPEFLKGMDTDGDGAVTLEEYKKGAEQMRANGRNFGGTPEERFARWDRNKDGSLRADELPFPGMLERMDANKDGAISLDEMKNATPPNVNPQGGPGGFGNNRPPSGEAFMNMMDKNHDGKVTQDEAPSKEWFTRRDANGDGVLTADELTAVRPGRRRDAGAQP